MPAKKLSIYEKFKTHRKYCRIKRCNACRPVQGRPPSRSSDKARPGDRALSDRRRTSEATGRGTSRENRCRESALRPELGRMQLSASESNERTFSERAFKDASPCDRFAVVQRVADSLVRSPNDLGARKSVSRDADGKLKDSTTLQDRTSASVYRHCRTASGSSSDGTAESAGTVVRETVRTTVFTVVPLVKAPSRSQRPSHRSSSVRLARLLVQLLLICKVNAQSIIKQTSAQQPASSASSLNSKSLASIKNAYTGKCPLLKPPCSFQRSILRTVFSSSEIVSLLNSGKSGTRSLEDSNVCFFPVLTLFNSVPTLNFGFNSVSMCCTSVLIVRSK